MPRKEHKYHYIYKTTNLINGKYYIGMHSTSNLNDGYIGSGNRIRRSINKHGKENFKFEILEFFPDRNSLKKREKELVNEDTLKDNMCLNLKIGGEGGFVNKEHRNKFFKSAKKTQFNSESAILGRNKMKYLYDNDDEWKKWFKTRVKPYDWTGRKHKEKTKKLIGEKNSINQKGENNSQFGSCWITNGIENKKIKKTDYLPVGWNKGRIIFPQV
jgi:hypothetical protein